MPVACNRGSVVTRYSSCKHTWSGGSACVLMSHKLTSSRWSRVSLWRLWRGCSQMGGTTDHPMIAVTSSMAVVTYNTTRSRVVLASCPPMTAVVVAGRIGLGAHVLGACCHRGAGVPTKGRNTALCCRSHVRIVSTVRPRGTCRSLALRSMPS